MQIELENELSLISDYAELTQAFKIPPGVARTSARGQQAPLAHYQQGAAPVHPRATPTRDDPVDRSPRWEIRTPESKRPPQQPHHPGVASVSLSRVLSVISTVIDHSSLSMCWHSSKRTRVATQTCGHLRLLTRSVAAVAVAVPHSVRRRRGRPTTMRTATSTVTCYHSVVPVSHCRLATHSTHSASASLNAQCSMWRTVVS